MNRRQIPADTPMVMPKLAMNPERLDQVGLLAMMFCALAALWYYFHWFAALRPLMSVSILAFLLLPPAWAGAGAYAIVCRRKERDSSPRGLAVFALGSGAVALVAWKLFVAAVIAHKRAFPPPDVYERGIGPVAFLVIPYMLLCAVLSIATVVTLPKLTWKSLRRTLRES